MTTMNLENLAKTNASVLVPFGVLLRLLKAAKADDVSEFGWTHEVIAEVTKPSRIDADGVEKGKNTPVKIDGKFQIGAKVLIDGENGLVDGVVTAVTKKGLYDVETDDEIFEGIAADYVHDPKDRAGAEKASKEAAAEQHVKDLEKAYNRAKMTIALLAASVKVADISGWGGKNFATLCSIVGLNPFKLKGLEGEARFKKVVVAAKKKQEEKGSLALLKAAKATVAAWEESKAKEAAAAEKAKKVTTPDTEYKPRKGGIKVGDWVRIGKGKSKITSISMKGSLLKVLVKASDDRIHQVSTHPASFVKDGKTTSGTIIWNPTEASIKSAD